MECEYSLYKIQASLFSTILQELSMATFYGDIIDSFEKNHTKVKNFPQT